MPALSQLQRSVRQRGGRPVNCEIPTQASSTWKQFATQGPVEEYCGRTAACASVLPSPKDRLEILADAGTRNGQWRIEKLEIAGSQTRRCFNLEPRNVQPQT